MFSLLLFWFWPAYLDFLPYKYAIICLNYQLPPPFSFIRHGQTRHGLPNYTLKTNSSYIILFVIMNVESLDNTFKYKFDHVKFTLQNKKYDE
jgi:hypothetical protein